MHTIWKSTRPFSLLSTSWLSYLAHSQYIAHVHDNIAKFPAWFKKVTFHASSLILFDPMCIWSIANYSPHRPNADDRKIDAPDRWENQHSSLFPCHIILSSTSLFSWAQKYFYTYSPPKHGKLTLPTAPNSGLNTAISVSHIW